MHLVHKATRDRARITPRGGVCGMNTIHIPLVVAVAATRRYGCEGGSVDRLLLDLARFYFTTATNKTR